MKNLTLFLFTSLFFYSHLLFSKELTVHVDGLVCSFCAKGIEKQFKKNENVESIKVDLKEKKVFIKVKENKDLTENTIKKTLEDSGYTFVKIESK